MAKTHYEVLGLSAKCSAAEIRSAYRKLVMLHHPDRSSDPKSKALFLAATEAYEVIGDPERRQQYDDRLGLEQAIAERRRNNPPSARLAEIKLDVNRLSTLYSRGNFPEAENLARSILERDRRQPIPYAVLGDIARMSGNKREAVRLYALATQYDPKNPVYRQRYDELTQSPVAMSHVSREEIVSAPAEKPAAMFAPFFGLGLVLIAGGYLVFAKEAPLLPSIGLISTWTLGLVVMLFFSGVAVGSSMALDGQLDNFQSGRQTIGGTAPWVALASIAVVNFWIAALMYLGIGVSKGSFNSSTSRILASVVAAVCVLAFAAEISGSISGFQVVLWGGNLVYLGAVCGWMVTDALRTAGG